MTVEDVAEALRALGARDIAIVGDRIATRATVLAAAQRLRLDALHAAVALDIVAPRPGATWRPTCCWCVDALEVVLGRDVEAYRVNLETRHDGGCCSWCDITGVDVLVAACPDEAFAAPPAAFLAIRRADRPGDSNT